MIRNSKGCLTLLLNDDIEITDKNFVAKLTKHFLDESNVGLVSGNPQPLKTTGLIDSGIVSSFRAYERMRYTFKNGHNKYSCDGKILAISGDFGKSLIFPKDTSKMGNVDIYLYFSCLTTGFLYRHSRKAIAYYRTPQTFKEYLKWTIRNNTDIYNMRNQFGSIVDKEFKKPLINYYLSLLKEFVKNPFGSSFIYFTGIYIKFKARLSADKFEPKWDVIKTSKKIK